MSPPPQHCTDEVAEDLDVEPFSSNETLECLSRPRTTYSASHVEENDGSDKDVQYIAPL